jgi:hypothetical protein
MMSVKVGHLRKMNTHANGITSYHLRLFDVLEPKEEVPLNDLVGKNVAIRFTGNINCVATGKKINKTFGEGLSFDAFKNSPLAAESIINPELSQAHLGIGLRDLDWEIEHHVKPHTVYISRTSGLKVGVTRSSNKLHRWADQGAVEAIVLAETPYRQLAGEIEVALKGHMADKTNWRNMLKNEVDRSVDLLTKKEEVKEFLPLDLKDFVSPNDEITTIDYPVIQYPEKVTSLKLDKNPEITGTLQGIKGQYLIFDGGRVINIRSHTAYEIEFEF